MIEAQVSSGHRLESGLTGIRCTYDSYVYLASVVLFRGMGFDGVDKTDRFIIAARRRAETALHETSPKLTVLEKAMRLTLN